MYLRVYSSSVYLRVYSSSVYLRVVYLRLWERGRPVAKSVFRLKGERETCCAECSSFSLPVSLLVRYSSLFPVSLLVNNSPSLCITAFCSGFPCCFQPVSVSLLVDVPAILTRFTVGHTDTRFTVGRDPRPWPCLPHNLSHS